jgi:hypothetical protein
MKSDLSGRAGCLYRQADGSWNVSDTLGDVIICNHLSATRTVSSSHVIFLASALARSRVYSLSLP